MLAQLPGPAAASARTLLQEAATLNGNRVLTLDEAHAALGPIVDALPDGGAAIRNAITQVDSFLDSERAREAVLGDGLEVFFNSRRDGLPGQLLAQLDELVSMADGRRLDVNAMVFSFTDPRISDWITDTVRNHPNVHVHMFTDWSQVSDSGGHQAPVLARLAKAENLPNLDIRFKKDNPYRWSTSRGRATYDHGKTQGLNHHKGVVALIDGVPTRLVTGSFNWTRSAATKNYENLMVINAGPSANRGLMHNFEHEFEALFNDGGMSLTYDEAREHKRLLFDQFKRVHRGGESIAIEGLAHGVGAQLDLLADSRPVDLNGWTSGEAIAQVFGDDELALGIARAMQAERLRFGRFSSMADLLDRLPVIASLPAAALDRVRHNTVFGDGLVRVNETSAEELQAIGAPPAVAEALLAHWQAHGDFESLAEVQTALGIEPSVWERLSRHLSDDINRVAFSAKAPYEDTGDSGMAAVNEKNTVPLRLADNELLLLDPETDEPFSIAINETPDQVQVRLADGRELPVVWNDDAEHFDVAEDFTSSGSYTAVASFKVAEGQLVASPEDSEPSDVLATAKLLYKESAQATETREVALSANTVLHVSATLGAGAIDMLRGAQAGDTVKIAMYGMSTSTPEFATLVEAIRRGVIVRGVLDKKYNGVAAAALARLNSEPDTDVLIKTSGRMMHQKYLVHVESADVFNGSANMSRSSSTKHSEDRFYIKNNPAIAADFEADFDRLWERLGPPVSTEPTP